MSFWDDCFNDESHSHCLAFFPPPPVAVRFDQHTASPLKAFKYLNVGTARGQQRKAANHIDTK